MKSFFILIITLSITNLTSQSQYTSFGNIAELIPKLLSYNNNLKGLNNLNSFDLNKLNHNIAEIPRLLPNTSISSTVAPTLEDFCRFNTSNKDRRESLPFLIQNFICNYTNESILNNYLLGKPKCFEIVSKLISANISGIPDIYEAFNWSGKGVNDIGSQNECLGNGLKYFFVELTYDLKFECV